MLGPARRPRSGALLPGTGVVQQQGELPDDAGPVDIDKAAIRRAGGTSLITYGGTFAHHPSPRQGRLADGIVAEVIDLRTLGPLDDATFVDSVRRTHRAVVVEEGGAAASHGDLSTVSRAGVLRLDAHHRPGVQQEVCPPVRPPWNRRRPQRRGCGEGRGATSQGLRRHGHVLMPSLGADMDENAWNGWCPGK